MSLENNNIGKPWAAWKWPENVLIIFAYYLRGTGFSNKNIQFYIFVEQQQLFYERNQ